MNLFVGQHLRPVAATASRAKLDRLRRARRGRVAHARDRADLPSERRPRGRAPAHGRARPGQDRPHRRAGELMSSEERNVWVFLVVAVLFYSAYVVVVLSRAQDVPLSEVAYVGPLLWSIGGAIVASIVGTIAVGLVNRRDGHLKDQRDKEIDRLGERTGQSFVVIGALARDGPGPRRGGLVLDRQPRLPLLHPLGDPRAPSPSSRPTGGTSPRGEAHPGHQLHPHPAVHARGDDPGRPGGRASASPARPSSRSSRGATPRRSRWPSRSPACSTSRSTTSSSTRADPHRTARGREVSRSVMPSERNVR